MGIHYIYFDFFYPPGAPSVPLPDGAAASSSSSHPSDEQLEPRVEASSSIIEFEEGPEYSDGDDGDGESEGEEVLTMEAFLAEGGIKKRNIFFEDCF